MVGGAILVLGILFPSQSKASCSEVFFAKIELRKTNDWPLVFTGVEFFRRNNNIGMQQFGDLKLTRWLDLPYTGFDNNFVGIADTGRIYHVIQYQDRTIARPLSGRRTFAEIFIAEPNLIAAVDDNGRVEVYDPGAWTRRGGIRSLAVYGFSVWTVLTGGTLALASSYGVEVPMEVLAGFVGVASAFQTQFLMSLRYMRNNTFPDGFVASHVRFESIEQLQRDLLPLVSKLRRAPNHFAVPDESELAPKLAEELGEPMNE